MEWLAGLLIFCVLVLTTILVFCVLHGKKRATRIVLLVISAIVLSYKSCEYLYYKIIGLYYKVPIEFSQIAYFIFPISVFLSKKTTLLQPFATFCAIMAGLFYDINWIFSPQSFIAEGSAFSLTVALICHNALYLGGMLMLTNNKMPAHKFWQLPVGTLSIIAWSYSVSYVVKYPDTVILKSICEGDLFATLIPAIATSLAAKIIYYTIMIFMFSLCIAVFYYVNYKCTKNITKDLFELNTAVNGEKS